MPFNYNSGHDPNTSNPPTRAYIVLGAVLPFYALSLLMVGSRILVKRKLGKLGVDDLLIAISTVREYGRGWFGEGLLTVETDPCDGSYDLHNHRYVLTLSIRSSLHSSN